MDEQETIIPGGGFFALVLFLSLCVSFSPAAPAQTLAEIENLGDMLVFHPLVGFSELILTVSGPCDFQSRMVVTDGEPFFALDERTIDGSYTFNLVRNEAIDPEIVAVLQQARLADDAETPRALCRDGMLPGAPISQSAGFTVSAQTIIFDEGVEESAAITGPGDGLPIAAAGGELHALDFPVRDDLIVFGSACIGYDCVDGESFGWDTLRLKENNLRLKFDDTSVAARFPRNDWQLTANDGANGGASKFSIDDVTAGLTPFTVEAKAPSHSLYVDDGGRIGNRTSTPSGDFHTIAGNSPTLRLQQDGSSGFEPQTWDIAGNETNFFVRDVSNGSTLPFKIRPGSPSNALVVDKGGRIGIGTPSPSYSVHQVTNSSTNAQFVAERTGGAKTILAGTASAGFFGTLNNFPMRLTVNNAQRMEIKTDGSIAMATGGGTYNASTGAWVDGSSRAYKENIVRLQEDEAMSAFGRLDPMKFNFKSSDENKVGFIAEDVPELVAENNRKGLSSMDIVAVLTKVLQHEHQVNLDQQSVILALEARLEALESSN